MSGQSMTEYIMVALAERVTHDLAATTGWALSVDEQAALLKIRATDRKPRRAVGAALGARAAQIAKQEAHVVGGLFIAVDPKDDGLAGWYAKQDFQPLGGKRRFRDDRETRRTASHSLRNASTGSIPSESRRRGSRGIFPTMICDMLLRDKSRFFLPLVLVAALGAVVPTGAPTRDHLRRTSVDIYFIDVEGGQSTLIVTPDDESLLIDAGFPGDGTFASVPGDPAKARDAQRILAAARDAGIRRIDHLMLTHYHADHAGGVPELAHLIPIAQFIDHAPPLAEANAAVAGTQGVYDRYVKLRASSPHLSPKPGDALPIKGVNVTVLSSVGATITSPVGGSGAPNPACVGTGLPAQEKAENPRSLGVVVQFGAFRFLDLGDLTGPPLFALTCPRDLIGKADVYLVAHHGGGDAADPALFATVKPRVSLFNNGATKGGAPETFATLRAMPTISVWQLHRSMTSGAINAADDRIANLDESTSAWIKLSARRDGSFAITNGRTGATTSYPVRN